MKSTTERRNEILVYLCERRHSNLIELIREFKVSRRTIIRASVDDINETLAHLKSRIISIQAAQDGMDQSKMMYKEDQKS